MKCFSSWFEINNYVFGIQISSYDGALKYSFSYNTTERLERQPTNHHDVVLEGNNGQGIYFKNRVPHPEPGQKHHVRVQLNEVGNPVYACKIYHNAVPCFPCVLAKIGRLNINLRKILRFNASTPCCFRYSLYSVLRFHNCNQNIYWQNRINTSNFWNIEIRSILHFISKN